MPNTKPSAFEKRVKRRISSRAHDFFAVCPPGLSSLCLRELTALAQAEGGRKHIQGFEEIAPLPGGVGFKTRLPRAWQANLSLGSPSKILMRIAAFKADGFSRLEKKISQVDWELFLPARTNLDIQVTTRKSRLYHSDAVAEKCRNAIENQLEILPALPKSSSGKLKPASSQTLMVRAEQDRFELSLDMSGGLLFKRGIKHKINAAPLRENLAFAILMAAGFGKDDVLVDPMCGSGSFSLEGAMIQANIPPGFFRSFAFENWPSFSKPGFENMKKNMAQVFYKNQGPGIFASDLDKAALNSLDETINRHRFLDRITTRHQDFFDLNPDRNIPGKGVVVLNPPYGKRLGKGMDMKAFFREIGKKLSRDFKGWRTGIIIPEKSLVPVLNLPLRPMPLFHGGMDLFAGIGRIP